MNRPVSANGNPIPWFTYAAIDYLQKFDLSGMKVFEWGSGNSSIFFAKRALAVISIEDSKEWADTLTKSSIANLHVLHRTGLEYVEAICKEGSAPPNIVVIDGVDRFRCGEILVRQPFLPDLTIIIVDNSDLYPGLVKLIDSHVESIRVDFHGFAPINDYTHTTSMWINSARAKPLLAHAAASSILLHELEIFD